MFVQAGGWRLACKSVVLQDDPPTEFGKPGPQNKSSLTTHAVVHERRIGCNRAIQTNLAHKESLLRAVRLAAPAATSADKPCRIRSDGGDARVVHVVAVSTVELDMVPRSIAKLCEKIRVGPEVVGRVVREHQHVLGLAGGHALVEELEGLLLAALQELEAGVGALRVLAGPVRPLVVHVQGDDLDVQIFVLDVVRHIRHVEVIQVAGVGVDLGALLQVMGASAVVVVEVMVAIDAVPGHRTNHFGVDVPPLGVPLRIGPVGDAARVEGIPDIDDETDVPECSHLLLHGIGDGLLAGDALDAAMDIRIPSPVTDDQEGPRARSRRGGDSRSGGDSSRRSRINHNVASVIVITAALEQQRAAGTQHEEDQRCGEAATNRAAAHGRRCRHLYSTEHMRGLQLSEIT
mmetsp:Transcript_85338/g.225080  ORF Transcript_85338/g.225080 Transcript_85338/m.225080 type:complete len:404 (-) Transcript_85338:8-1219(-)